MGTIVLILIVLFVWCIQALCAVWLNILYCTRPPRSVFDFFRLTFFPYVLYCYLYDTKLLD